MHTGEFLAGLSAANLISGTAASRAERASKETGTAIERTLLEFGMVAEDDLFQHLATHLKLPFVTAPDCDPSLMKNLSLPLDFLQRSEVVPVSEGENGVLLATSNPRGQEVVRSIGYHLKSPVHMAIASPSTIKALLTGTKREAVASDTEVSSSDIERLNALANDGPVIKLVNDLIAQAVDQGASDIHIEASETGSHVRYRIDGALYASSTVPAIQTAAVASRLKVMATLNISEKRRPQDGRAQLSVRGRNVDIRLSTLPTQFGESIVLRLLDRHRVTLDWDALGFPPKVAGQIENLVAQPNGIFLVAGPTGSGKTTTLYTALSGLNLPERKILTVEDPIEFSLEGINQVQVDPGIQMSFARALRAILRQDPDVIMVGEIRDEETAEIAVRAALVGRMVLSTIHTNDSLSAVPRLLDLGVPPYLLAATLRGVLSQRLVRKLCSNCPGKGCERCEGSGYSGRTVLAELLHMPPGSALSAAISGSASLEQMHSAARQEGFMPMLELARDLVDKRILAQDDVHRALGS